MYNESLKITMSNILTQRSGTPATSSSLPSPTCNEDLLLCSFVQHCAHSEIISRDDAMSDPHSYLALLAFRERKLKGTSVVAVCVAGVCAR